jgi:hypothetical protein
MTLRVWSILIGPARLFALFAHLHTSHIDEKGFGKIAFVASQIVCTY